MLTPAFARRGRERATDTTGAAAAALSLDEEVSSEELVVVVVFLALRAEIEIRENENVRNVTRDEKMKFGQKLL